MKTLAKLMGIKHLFTSSHRPQSNSKVERVNSSILNILRVLASKTKLWCDMLPVIRFNLNTGVNASSQYSPYFLAHGVDPRLGEYCHLTDPKSLTKDERVVMETMLPELSKHRALAKENIQRSAEMYKEAYDRKFRVGYHRYRKGDTVWIKSTRPAGTAVGKTDPYHTGPFRVVDTVGDVLFRLQDVKTGVAVTSLMHGNNLTYSPDGDSSELRRLRRRHKDIPVSETQDGDKTCRIEVKSGLDNVQEITTLPRRPPRGPSVEVLEGKKRKKKRK